MPTSQAKIGTIWSEYGSTHDKALISEDVTYRYYGWAPRGSATSEPVWYIRRVTLLLPSTQESASTQYNQVWDDIATITTWA